jgi:hypothetical protein
MVGWVRDIFEDDRLFCTVARRKWSLGDQAMGFQEFRWMIVD